MTNTVAVAPHSNEKVEQKTSYSSLTRRITALKSPGDLLQTAPTINPPALVPRAAVN